MFKLNHEDGEGETPVGPVVRTTGFHYYGPGFNPLAGEPKSHKPKERHGQRKKGRENLCLSS